MERKYEIDVNFLKFLKETIKECQGIQKEVDLFLIERLIRILEDPVRHGSREWQIEKQLQEDLDEVSFYRPYYPYVRYFRSNGKIFDEPYSPNYNTISLSDSDTVDLMHEFYISNGPDYKDDMHDFLDEAKDHLKFVSGRPYFEGETTFIKSTGEFFCLVPNYQNITKATVLVHETTHIFDWYRNPDFIKNYLINEFNSLFKEMIASDYFSQQLGLEKDGLERRFYLHNLIKRYADDIFYRTQILYLFAKERITNNTKKIYEIFGTDYLKYLTQDSLIDNYIYQISYLIAIELYELYKIDKDKALWIADYIVKYGNNDNIMGILEKNGIVLNKHSIEYENDLRLKLRL